GPQDFQVDCWAHILEKIPVILIAPTRGGKPAAFHGPILITVKLCSFLSWEFDRHKD
ncbi:hypothetical protein L208DRAFT_1257605, partial [Tricholoma matsutake]